MCIDFEFLLGQGVQLTATECQTSDATYEGIYSPQSCDIWSLGIVFLNIVTGRNPWRSATREDSTFRSYCRNPFYFLPKILPISLELNDVLVMMLNMEWRARPSIPEIRSAINKLETFYSTDVIFEGNVARCPCEMGMDLGTGTHKDNVRVDVPVPPKLPERPRKVLTKDPAESFDDDCLDDSDENEMPASIEDSCRIRYTSSYPPLRPTSKWDSVCSSDPPSPVVPDDTYSSTDPHLPHGPTTPFNSLVRGMQRLFRLYSSFDPLHLHKNRSPPDSEMFTIDL